MLCTFYNDDVDRARRQRQSKARDVSRSIAVAGAIDVIMVKCMGGAIGGARGAMAPPIIWLGGHTVFAPPNILHWNLKF